MLMIPAVCRPLNNLYDQIVHISNLPVTKAIYPEKLPHLCTIPAVNQQYTPISSRQMRDQALRA